MAALNARSICALLDDAQFFVGIFTSAKHTRIDSCLLTVILQVRRTKKRICGEMSRISLVAVKGPRGGKEDWHDNVLNSFVR